MKSLARMLNALDKCDTTSMREKHTKRAGVDALIANMKSEYNAIITYIPGKGYKVDTDSYIKWETVVTANLAAELNTTYSEAQGIMEAQPEALKQAWNELKTAQDTAKIISEKSLVK